MAVSRLDARPSRHSEEPIARQDHGRGRPANSGGRPTTGARPERGTCRMAVTSVMTVAASDGDSPASWRNGVCWGGDVVSVVTPSCPPRGWRHDVQRGGGGAASGSGGAAPFVAPWRGASGVLGRRCSPTRTRLARPRGAPSARRVAPAWRRVSRGRRWCRAVAEHPCPRPKSRGSSRPSGWPSYPAVSVSTGSSSASPAAPRSSSHERRRRASARFPCPKSSSTLLRGMTRPSHPDDGLLFIGSEGQRLRRYAFGSMWRDTVASAGAPGVVFYGSGTTTPRSRVDESVGTPGSVPRGRYQPRSDGHPSRPAIADQFQRPTRRLGRAVLEHLLSGLAPGGVYLAVSVT